MLITIQQKPTDPPYPIMGGDTPFAKEFNKRSKVLWERGLNVENMHQLVSEMINEILVDDYNRRHASRKRASKKKFPQSLYPYQK